MDGRAAWNLQILFAFALLKTYYRNSDDFINILAYSLQISNKQEMLIVVA